MKPRLNMVVMRGKYSLSTVYGTPRASAAVQNLLFDGPSPRLGALPLVDARIIDGLSVEIKAAPLLPSPGRLRGYAEDTPGQPNFFIVGAARCGTTSLFEALGRHPDVFCCPVKEPNYFAFDYVRVPTVMAEARRQGCLIDGRLDTKLAPPRVAYTVTDQAYRDLFRDWHGQAAVGEASTAYLPSRAAPGAIAARHPDARIIVVLRNPIDRVISDYRMHRQNGHNVGSFAHFIVREDGQGDRSTSRGVVSSSLYAEQIRRYLDHFRPEQILFLLFDDLVRSPTATLRTVFRHIGVDPAAGRHIRIGWENKSRKPRFAWLDHALMRWGKRGLVLRALPRPLRHALRPLFYRTEKAPSLSREDHRLLLDHFRSDIAETALLIGRDLDHWAAEMR